MDRFYVSVIRSRLQYRLLLGPYDKAEHAELMVDFGRRLAVAYDPWCEFDSFGVAKISRPEILNFPTGIFGKI